MSVAAIIPAYNEEKNIGTVLSILTAIEEITEIIVINDGSTDSTSHIARSHGVKVVDLERNQGKSIAMYQGIIHTKAPIILFLDADLIGLTSQHVNNMIYPIINGYAEMTLGIFNSGRSLTDLAHKITPFLTGQRALFRWILNDLKPEDWLTGYGIEMAITRLAKRSDLRVVEILLEETTHAMKEEKLGLVRGMASRAKMYWEIMKQLAQ
ncbi:MAG: glycosyltransferase family 2 protein [Clostridiales bacterium]|nr:glycosyltransferase family 2 protein [Clostridiales bacterium]